MMRGPMVRAVAAVLLVFLVLLFLLLVLLVAQHVCADCASNHSADGTQRSTTKLVTKECATSASYEG